MRYLVISCSLHPESRSRVLARAAHAALPEDRASFIDLAGMGLPFCDGWSAHGDENAVRLKNAVETAAGILVATPVYNYSVSASAKNLVELTGQAWTGKTVGLLCAAGGSHGYMGGMPFLNSLMLDFRCFVLPRFVYCQGDSIRDGRIADPRIGDRVQQLAAELVRVTDALLPRLD